MATLDSRALIILNLRSGTQARLWFPETISSSDTVNYEAIDVAGGAKPQFYANREPQEISLESLYIDGTTKNESIEPQLSEILLWRVTDSRFGAPPPLQILTGELALKVVLTSVNIEREKFSTGGVCLRARLDLTFAELREIKRNLSNPVKIDTSALKSSKKTARKRNPARRSVTKRRGKK